MSTTKTLKVNQNFDRLLKCRANGYYDYVDVIIPTKDTKDINVEMQEYNGLKYTLNTQGDVGTPILDFSETVLPWKFEMNNYLARTRYCWKPYREEPYQVEIMKQVPTNYNIVGNLVYNGTKHILGFSRNDYLMLKKPFKPKGAWEIVLNFEMNEYTDREQCLLGYNGTGLFKICVGGNKRVILSLSTVDYDWNIGEITGTTDIVLNRKYWVKAEFTGSVYKLSLSIDGIAYNLEGTLETTSVPVFPDTTLIGVANHTYNYFIGTIGLSGSYFKQKEISAEGEGELTEIAFSQPILTENGTMGGSSFAVSADNDTNGSKPAYYAFDDSDSSFWRGGNVPGYIEFYNPAPINVTALTWGFYYSYPTSGNVQGSNDYSDWAIITEFTNDSASDFTIDMSGNTNSYKYYRINVSSVNMDVLHCKNLSIVGTVKGYAVENTYKLSERTYVPDLIRNYTVNGSPTINDNIVSGFSSSNYLTLDNSFVSKNATYVFKVTFPSSMSVSQCIFEQDYFANIEFRGNTQDLRAWNWQTSQYEKIMDITFGKTYWFKMVINDSVKTYSYSEDGQDYIEAYVMNDNATNTTSSNFFIGVTSRRGNIFQGSIDVYDSYVLINDKTTYLVSTATEELYGIIDGEEFYVYLPSYCYVNKDQNLIVRQNKIEKINDTTDWYLREFMMRHPDYELDV